MADWFSRFSGTEKVNIEDDDEVPCSMVEI
jgi:hypothetical protein